MEDKRLKRVFDQVRLSQEREEAMLADLLSEKKEVSSMKQTNNRRRIPAAALAAAVLVIALAGTAMAAEYLGWIKIEPISSWLGPDGPEEVSGYAVTFDDTQFPAENLSEEVFSIGEEIGDVHLPRRMIAFDSWSACEEFLGVDLANNSRLDQMQRDIMQVDDPDHSIGRTHAYVSLNYSKLMPSYITTTACYREGNNIHVGQSVKLRTQYAPDKDPEQWDMQIPQNGEEPLAYVTYITSAGVEATIFTDTYDTPISTYTSCYASFIKDNMYFTLNVSVKTHEGQEPTNAPDAMELTKEILDAYE